EPLRQRDEPDRPRLVGAVAPPTHGRVEAPDAVDVVLGEAPPEAAVRREHDGAGHRRVTEAEQVTGLVEGDGLDVERTPGPREAPGLGVVEVELPGVTAAARRRVERVRERVAHAVERRAVAVVARGPGDLEV